MLEPVAKNQLSFRIAGLFQDGRGVVVGTEAVVVLLSIERVVSLTRLLSEELPLDDLVPTLRIELCKNPLGSTLYLLRFQCRDSLLLDRVARLARLLSAPLCVGAGRHFVAYRDDAAPLGYDATTPLAEPGDLAIYTPTLVQPCRKIKELSLRDLVEQLQLLTLPGGLLRELAQPQSPDDSPAVSEPIDEIYLTCGTTLLPRLVRYLWQTGASGDLLIPDPLPSPEGLPSDRIFRAPIVRLVTPPLSLLLRLLTLPSVRLLRREGSNFLIDLGHAHPLQLTSMQSLFPAADLYLFLAGRRGSLRAKSPSKTPLGRFVTPQIAPPGENDDAAQPLQAVRLGSSTSPPPPLKLTLRLVAAHSALQDPLSATLIPWHRLATLQRLLGLLSGEAIFSLHAVGLPAGLFCFGSAAVQHLCAGQLFAEVSPQVFVPARTRLLPDLPPSQLRALVQHGDDHLVVFLPAETQPIAVPKSLASPLSLRLLQSLATKLPDALIEPAALRDSFPVLHCEPISFFSTLPLWGLASDPERG